METVSIIIATYGDEEKWNKIKQPAIRSALNQTRSADRLIVNHVSGDNDYLAQARNDAAEQADTDWIIFLDADDTLDHKYVEKMLEGEGDVRQPSTLGVYPNGAEDKEPVLIPEKDLLTGNYIVIGAMMRTDLFKRCWFRDFPLYEDWDLYLRMQEAGAKFGKCPEAIYRVSVGDGRNTPSRAVQDKYLAVIKYEAKKRRGLL